MTRYTLVCCYEGYGIRNPVKCHQRLVLIIALAFYLRLLQHILPSGLLYYMCHHKPTSRSSTYGWSVVGKVAVAMTSVLD
mgnify:CR=1 FL=1